MIFAFVRRLLREEGGLSPCGLALVAPIGALVLAGSGTILPLF